MKTTFTKIGLFALLLSSVLFGDTTVVYSTTTTSATARSDQWNNSGVGRVPNINPTLSANWSATSNVSSSAEWISPWRSGNEFDGAFVDVQAGIEVTFTQILYVGGTPSTTSSDSYVTAMAADTTSVVVNGTTVVSQGIYSGNEYNGCGGDGAGVTNNGCRFDTKINAVAIGAYLHSGVNVIEFKVKKLYQTGTNGLYALDGGKTGFGLIYKILATYTPGTGCPN